MNSEFRETQNNGKYKWVCKPGVRNEALDCTVYALTAVDIVRLMTGNAAIDTTGVDDIDFAENDDELTLSNLLSEVKKSSTDESTKSQTIKQPTTRIKRKL